MSATSRHAALSSRPSSRKMPAMTGPSCSASSASEASCGAGHRRKGFRDEPPEQRDPRPLVGEARANRGRTHGRETQSGFGTATEVARGRIRVAGRACGIDERLQGDEQAGLSVVEERGDLRVRGLGFGRRAAGRWQPRPSRRASPAPLRPPTSRRPPTRPSDTGPCRPRSTRSAAGHAAAARAAPISATRRRAPPSTSPRTAACNGSSCISRRAAWMLATPAPFSFSDRRRNCPDGPSSISRTSRNTWQP